MIPWLLLVETVSIEGRPLSEIIQARIDRYPVSGEINRTVEDPHEMLKRIEEEFRGRGGTFDYTDGLSVEFDSWRFNLRPSNTEPVIRLNVEARQDKQLLTEKTEEILSLIERFK
jgi:phosphomannomutase/phosphomannomutase/phosphoglucomutase